MEDRHEIVRALANADRKVTTAPSERSIAQREMGQAQQRISDAESALIRAQADLDRYDRPLHRRRHATEIDSARRDVARLPGVIAEGRKAVTKTATRLRQLDVDLHDAMGLVRRRPTLEAKVAELDDLLDTDLRRRTRIARLEQSAAIVGVLGARPSPGATARAWDQAAGRLHQHQSAFNLAAGVGPRPGLLDNSAFTESRRLVERELEATVPAPDHRVRWIEPPSLSL